MAGNYTVICNSCWYFGHVACHKLSFMTYVLHFDLKHHMAFHKVLAYGSLHPT